MIQQKNFDGLRSIAHARCPQLETYLVPGGSSSEAPANPPLALIGPSVATAIFNATGKRLRETPLPAGRIHSINRRHSRQNSDAPPDMSVISLWPTNRIHSERSFEESLYSARSASESLLRPNPYLATKAADR